ncbi:hypothetical protein B8W69_06600 [Mycobacterium vulneris]|uniref:Prohead serine protease domain-containing protein n=1 Tax=Mycolicibacterium vulneris TaxID=547163 RepID=A0A1X2L9N8_9MYCO|nr:HK97 family phage prohead protease [Mycolicibacterium vulneris]OSC30701.1 hypothetical protein B8W69_06600 [Mycolicibacterium vulneris]
MSNNVEMERLSTAWWSGVPKLEVRSLPNKPHRMVIGGIAALFGAPSNPRLGFTEIVERSCFNKSQGDGYPLVRALYEHQPDIVLGAVHSGTMRIFQDGKAMTYEVDMPATRSAEYESIARGDVHSSSIAFQAYQDEWRRGTNGYPERHLLSARLDHIAPTSMPAYPDATVSLRSLAAEMEADLDEVVRDAVNNNLNRYFVRSDQMVSAPTTVEPGTSPAPALVETRNAQSDPALVAAMQANRARRYPSDNRHRGELGRLVARNRAKRYPPSISADDGREYYARRALLLSD